MNRAGLTSFIGRLQTELAGLFPAVISIAAQSYPVASSRLMRERDLVTGGWLDKYKVTFIVAVAAFAAATKPVAKARDYITITSLSGAAPVIPTVVVAEAVLDATGSTLTLRCESPEE